VILRTLRGCSPFVVCGVVSLVTTWRLGTVLAFALSIALLIYNRWTGNAPGEAFLEASSAVFCGLAAIVAFSVSESPVRGEIDTISAGWQAMTAWASLALGWPFTLREDVRSVPRAQRRRLPPYQVSVVVSTIWAAGFTALTIVLALLHVLAPHMEILGSAVEIAGTALPALFVLRYENTERPGNAAAGKSARKAA
jgi:hypothetical protein